MCYGCTRHITPGTPVTITLTGYQGPAQHTYTRACAGFHEPGPCPPPQSASIAWAYDYIKGAYAQEDAP